MRMGRRASERRASDQLGHVVTTMAIMSEEENRRLILIAQAVRAQLRRNEMRALVARFEDHVQRVGQGQSPGIESRLEELRAELSVAEQQAASVSVQPGGSDRAREIAEAKAKLAALERQAEQR
jgi:hypothetical protein